MLQWIQQQNKKRKSSASKQEENPEAKLGSSACSIVCQVDRAPYRVAQVVGSLARLLRRLQREQALDEKKLRELLTKLQEARLQSTITLASCTNENVTNGKKSRNTDDDDDEEEENDDDEEKVCLVSFFHSNSSK